jgi:endonuclease/exonuclease/phosphatase family metal-dependent hydrolase
MTVGMGKGMRRVGRLPFQQGVIQTKENTAGPTRTRSNAWGQTIVDRIFQCVVGFRSLRPRGAAFAVWCGAVALLLAGLSPALDASQKFTVGSFNLENYTDGASATRTAKSREARGKVWESLRTLRADVLGLQEIGGTNTLMELRASLKAEGLDYPYWEHVSGHDTNIFVAVLSRFPIIARRPHSREGFLLEGRRFRLTRGIAEVDIQVSPTYSFTLLVAHLKSRRPSAEADESELREQEALVLREKVEDRLKGNANANLIVAGDFNDVKDAPSTRAIIGKGKFGLIDTRPAERNGDTPPSTHARLTARTVTWTHFYGKEDSYSRIDYILVSHGMAREWDPAGTYVLALPNWGIASDHRPIVASFTADDL